MSRRFAVTRNAAADFGDTQVYAVRRKSQPEWKAVGVWWNPVDKRLNCQSCSGPLSAMLSSCPHANAVRRVVAKKSQKKRP